MPYENEFAQYKPLRRIVENERVKRLLGSYKIQDSPEESNTLEIIDVDELEHSGWLPDWILAVDGSHAEVDVQNGYPGAEASYITVASVLIDLAKTRELDKQRPVRPKDFRTIEQAESIDWALPGCNVIYEADTSAEESLRHSVFELFSDFRMSDNGETLLETYEALLAYKPTTETQKCPYDDCPVENGEYVRNRGRYSCRCPYARNLYSTDALRFYERMNPAGTNGAIFGEVIQVLERVWIIHVLRTLEAHQWLSSLRKLAIVLDGPLAVFGQPAWISEAIYHELSRLNEVIRKVAGQDLLMIGIEKSGVFLDHLFQIDRYHDGRSGRYPNGGVALLTDDYIKRCIIFSNSDRPYGRQTYFGRKLFYKTRGGAMLVATLPFLSDEHKDLRTAEISQFPRLSDAVNLLDPLVSSRYPNALTPIVAAHAEAAIPLNLGKKVLERLARELTGRS